VRGKLADAVRALQRAESAAATPVDSTHLDRAISEVRSQDPRAITTNRDWVSDKHELDIQLATFRANVTGADADQAALKAILAQQPDVDDDISILAAIENGPETLWRSASHSPGPALVPGPLGWVIVGALLLGLFAWLLKVNASAATGNVCVLVTASFAARGVLVLNAQVQVRLRPASWRTTNHDRHTPHNVACHGTRIRVWNSLIESSPCSWCGT